MKWARASASVLRSLLFGNAVPIWRLKATSQSLSIQISGGCLGIATLCHDAHTGGSDDCDCGATGITRSSIGFGSPGKLRVCHIDKIQQDDLLTFVVDAAAGSISLAVGTEDDPFTRIYADLWFGLESLDDWYSTANLANPITIE